MYDHADTTGSMTSDVAYGVGKSATGREERLANRSYPNGFVPHRVFLGSAFDGTRLIPHARTWPSEGRPTGHSHTQDGAKTVVDVFE